MHLSPRFFELTVHAFRGALVESRHRLWISVHADSVPDASPLSELPVAYMRSTAKPFQLLALMMQDDIVSRYELQQEDLALMAASHDGTDAHADRARHLLERLGFSEADLQCGVHRPSWLEEATLDESRSFPGYDSLHHNCSGNHAGMLALGRIFDVPKSNYLDPKSASQAAVHRLLKTLTAGPVDVAVDNCGSPCYAMPIEAITQLYALLGRPESLAERPEACRMALEAQAPLATWMATLDRISRALAQCPEWASGEATGATRIARQSPGELILKHGAEALLCVAHRTAPGALVLKVQDGNARALFPAALHVMETLGWLGASQLASLQDLRVPTIRGHSDQKVGHLEIAVGVP